MEKALLRVFGILLKSQNTFFTHTLSLDLKNNKYGRKRAFVI